MVIPWRPLTDGVILRISAETIKTGEPEHMLATAARVMGISVKDLVAQVKDRMQVTAEVIT